MNSPDGRRSKGGPQCGPLLYRLRSLSPFFSCYLPPSISPPPKPRMTNPTPNPQEKPQLARALEKNDAIQDTVERSAQELDLVNTVLEKGIPAAVKTGDV